MENQNVHDTQVLDVNSSELKVEPAVAGSATLNFGGVSSVDTPASGDQMPVGSSDPSGKQDSVSSPPSTAGGETSGGDNVKVRAGMPVLESAESLLSLIQQSSVYQVFDVGPPSDNFVYRPDAIPQAMKGQKYWLNIRSLWDADTGKFTKKPFDPISGFDAQWSKSIYHHTFNEVWSFVRNKWASGFAYLFTEGQGLVCVDIDGCIVDGQLTPFAQEVIRLFRPTYLELSVSRRGLHIICKADLPFAGSSKEVVINGVAGEIELYSARRLITMTGLITDGWVDLQPNQEAIDVLVAQMKPPRKAIEHTMPQKSYDPPRELKRLKSALEFVSPKSYWTWLQVLMALNQYAAEYNCWDEAWELFDWWSQREGNYNADENRWHWDNFDTEASDNPITIGTVYYLAKDGGWTYDNRALSSAVNGEKGGRPEAAVHADTAERFYNEVVVDPESGNPTLLHNQGQWRRYSGVDGWKMTGRDKVLTLLTTFMQNDGDLRPLSSNHYNNSVMTNLQSHNYCGTEAGMPSWTDTGETAENWMAFGNDMVVDVLSLAKMPQGMTIAADSGIYRPKSPAFFSQMYVGYDINLGLFKDQLFQEYLKTVLPDTQDRRMLQEMFGLALIADTSREVFHVLVGKGANGKTVALDILQALVGSQNVSNIDLHLLGERFQDFPLATSRVNICGELMTDVGRGALAKMEGKLKHYVSGGGFEVERKGQDKYDAVCRAKFIMSTNSLPTFIDRSDAIWRRMRVIKFPVTIPEDEQDEHLARKIIAGEMTGVFAWALEGLRSVLHHGKVFESEASRAVKDAHRRQCDKELTFMDECCEFDSGFFVPSTTLFDGYQNWCRDNNYRPLSSGRFFSRLLEEYPEVRKVQRKVRLGNGKTGRQRGFSGIRVVNQICLQPSVVTDPQLAVMPSSKAEVAAGSSAIFAQSA